MGKERLDDSILDGITACHGNNGYCLVRDLIQYGLPLRSLMQEAVISKFKFVRGIHDENGGWKTAKRVWRDEGHAKRFEEVYKEGLKVDEIYVLLFPEWAKNNLSQ